MRRGESQSPVREWRGKCPPSSLLLLVTTQWLVLGSGPRLTLLQRGGDHQETLHTNTPVREVRALGRRLLVVSDLSLSVVSEALACRLRVETSTRITAVRHNKEVVAVVDVHHVVYFYPRQEVETGEGLVLPVSRVTLPTLPGPYSLPPVLALTHRALVCGERGANRLHRLLFWDQALPL